MKPFDDTYFKNRLNIAWRAPVVVDVFLKFFSPLRLVYDVGCSVGEFIKELKDHDVKAVGYEVSTPALKHLVCEPKDVIIKDWSVRITKKPPAKADLLLFFEVAPFLSPEQQRRMALNLVRMSDTILTTSEGECRKHFLENKFYEDYLVGGEIREALKPWGHKPAIKSLYRALKVYRKEK